LDLQALKQHLNSEPVKYGILLLSSPVWLPFMKALWRALNDALRDEGGIMGHAPTAAELRAMNRQLGEHVSPLISVTWKERETGADLRASARRDRAGNAGVSTSAPAKARGFRSMR
jgi:hypothetical protein